jgi:hypothetical protein
MIHKSEPSQLFLDSIHTAYHLAQGQGEITPSGIWNYVVAVCLQRRKGFDEMFAWDLRLKPSQKRNRIGDIAEAIRQGYVPGMRLAMNAKGREIVVHDEGEVGS